MCLLIGKVSESFSVSVVFCMLSDLGDITTM